MTGSTLLYPGFPLDVPSENRLEITSIRINFSIGAFAAQQVGPTIPPLRYPPIQTHQAPKHTHLDELSYFLYSNPVVWVPGYLLIVNCRTRNRGTAMNTTKTSQFLQYGGGDSVLVKNSLFVFPRALCRDTLAVYRESYLFSTILPSSMPKEVSAYSVARGS